MKRSALILLSSALLLPIFANAGQFYISGAIGAGRADFDEEAFDATFEEAGLAILESDVDNQHAAWQLQLGYRFTDYIGVEAGFTTLGSFPYKALVDAGGGETLSFTIDSKGYGIDAVAVGAFPIGQSFEIFGAAGAMYTRVSQTLQVGEPFNEELDDFDETSVSPTFAVGVQWFGRGYDGERRVALRASVQRFMDVGEEDTTGQTDVDVAWIGAMFLFGR
jgi:OmpA-OmpF porin, OOP family